MAESEIAILPRTIAELPFFASGRYPKPMLLGRCRGEALVAISGRELVEQVRDLALGLQSVGMTQGSRVAILSESRPEWLLTDFAVLATGAVTTPIYPTLPVEQVNFILRDCEATLVVVSTPDQLAKVQAAAPDLPSLRGVVIMDMPATVSAAIPVWSLAEIAARGHKLLTDGWGVAKEFQDHARAIAPSDLATIIYTSGTTGDPKGVMLSHGNLVANVKGVLDVLDLHQGDTALSFLPLCHAFERLVAYVYLTSGVSMVFAESLDTVARDLRTVRPTVMTGVPRVFEKLQSRIVEKGQRPGGVKRRIFDWAMRVAVARGHALTTGGLSLSLRLQSALAERLVFKKIRDGLGGRIRYTVSGSAPLSPVLAKFYYGMGIPVLEGYGLTETSPVLSVVPLERVRFGTVGPPLPNVEIKIASDGEILARGPNVMSGYYKRPQDTAAALQDGWFHTGDIGTLDAAGYVCITDRKKELIVTSGGKKIAPQVIESAFRADPLIAEAVLIGEQRHFPTALLVPDFPALCRSLNAPLPADAAAAQALIDRADVRALFDQAIAAINSKLAQFERVKRYTLIPRELTLAAGELTPTLKVKRRVVEEKYRDEIERMYR